MDSEGISASQLLFSKSGVTDGGLSVTKEMLDILKKPGFLSTSHGGQRLRNLYVDRSASFEGSRLSPFALSCFIGAVDIVAQHLRKPNPPSLSGTETPYKFGYATLIISGAQRMAPGSGLQPKSDHLATLKLLISRGMPLDVPDIVGYTALHHAIISPSIHVPLFKELLSSGANVNVQNRYGEVPIFCAFMKHHIPAIELLLEYDADLTIAEADGLRPDTAAITFGPQVTAVVQKWIRKRKGEEPAPRDEKRCGCCGDTEKPLKNCGRCQVERYCSVECQRKAWPTHKRTCQPFSSSNTVTLKPFYGGFGPGGLVENLMPMSELRNKYFGINQPTPDAHHRHAAVPKNLDSDSKNIIIKAQLPYRGGFGKFDFSPTANPGDILVYTKKRDLMIAEKGVGGAKAYFAAELRSKEELVVKVGEVLAEQPF